MQGPPKKPSKTFPKCLYEDLPSQSGTKGFKQAKVPKLYFHDPMPRTEYERPKPGKGAK